MVESSSFMVSSGRLSAEWIIFVLSMFTTILISPFLPQFGGSVGTTKTYLLV